MQTTESHNQYIVFSVYQEGRDDSHNLAAHREIINLFSSRNVSYKELEGCYKGLKEKSILLPLTRKNELYVYNLASEHNQESVLLLEDYRDGIMKAYLQYTHDVFSPEFIGYLKSTPADKIESGKLDYSYDAMQDVYFTIQATA